MDNKPASRSASSADSEDESKETPLWLFTALDDYQRPQASLEQSVHKGLGMLRDWFQREFQKHTHSDDIEPFIDHKQLQQLSAQQLQGIVPESDWDSALPALDERMRPWLEAEQHSPRSPCSSDHRSAITP
ncbi:MAG: hypothetical protein R3E95_09875 [Thiolinea sp.]